MPEAKCFGPRDRRCRIWKLDPQLDPDNEVDYDVEHVVAERINPHTKKMLWLVKWAVSKQWPCGVLGLSTCLDMTERANDWPHAGTLWQPMSLEARR